MNNEPPEHFVLRKSKWSGYDTMLKTLWIKNHEKHIQSCIKQDKIITYVIDVVCMRSRCDKRKCEKHWIEHFTLETAQRWITDWQGEIMEERVFYPIIMHFKIKYICVC